MYRNYPNYIIVPLNQVNPSSVFMTFVNNSITWKLESVDLWWLHAAHSPWKDLHRILEKATQRSEWLINKSIYLLLLSLLLFLLVICKRTSPTTVSINMDVTIFIKWRLQEDLPTDGEIKINQGEINNSECSNNSRKMRDYRRDRGKRT